MPTMLLVASLLVAGLATQAVRAQATIYGISEYGPQDTDIIIKETTSFSVAGVGPGGVTTYIKEVVESYEAVVDAISATTTTFVFLDSPKTFDAVFVESSGGYSESLILSTISLPETVTNIGFGCNTGVDSKPTCTSFTALQTISTQAPEIIVCQFNADEEGNCTDLLPEPAGSDHTFSFSGSMVPIYTLAATASTPANTNQSGAVFHVVQMWWNGMFAVLVVLVNLFL
ncbi:hypothetical protein C8F04DRAFT_1387713 [Mycena alexandri]|uniref:Uncharacterized protein n=1 Tax=Mycena alexandri TaxID=1745969 RepID=A0AAD6THZ1_9AGAR|nr:hypothetical protein C8F04DRAFT_1387713 [Mycena alexandri]